MLPEVKTLQVPLTTEESDKLQLRLTGVLNRLMTVEVWQCRAEPDKLSDAAFMSCYIITVCISWLSSWLETKTMRLSLSLEPRFIHSRWISEQIGDVGVESEVWIQDLFPTWLHTFNFCTKLFECGMKSPYGLNHFDLRDNMAYLWDNHRPGSEKQFSLHFSSNQQWTILFSGV